MIFMGVDGEIEKKNEMRATPIHNIDIGVREQYTSVDELGNYLNRKETLSDGSFSYYGGPQWKLDDEYIPETKSSSMWIYNIPLT
jgi:hypothetical protein